MLGSAGKAVIRNEEELGEILGVGGFLKGCQTYRFLISY